MRNVFLGTVILLGALLAACSGSLGGSSALPGGAPPPLQQAGPNAAGVAPAGGATVKPSSTPDTVSAQVTVTGGGSVELPSAGDFGVTIALPKTTASPYTLAATTALVPSESVPDIGGAVDKSKRGILGGKGKTPRKPYTGLVYVSITPSTTLELDQLPKMSFSVPQPVLDKYGKTPDLQLAYLDGTEKGLNYKMAVAERVAATPTPIPSTTPSASPSPSPTPSATPTPLASGSPGTKLPTFPPALSATPPPKVPVNFASTAMPLKLQAGKTYTFVLYVVTPNATPSPGPSGSGAPAVSGSGNPSSSASPSASGSPGAQASSPATSASASASGAPAAAGSPGATSAAGSSSAASPSAGGSGATSAAAVPSPGKT